MRDGASGRSRGFGFLTFRDPKVVNTVMVKEHYLDGDSGWVNCERCAVPGDEHGHADRGSFHAHDAMATAGKTDRSG